MAMMIATKRDEWVKIFSLDNGLFRLLLSEECADSSLGNHPKRALTR
jgi:hypothetical protein